MLHLIKILIIIGMLFFGGCICGYSSDNMDLGLNNGNFSLNGVFNL
jgi:hypothetical protein